MRTRHLSSSGLFVSGYTSTQAVEGLGGGGVHRSAPADRATSVREYDHTIIVTSYVIQTTRARTLSTRPSDSGRVALTSAITSSYLQRVARRPVTHYTRVPDGLVARAMPSLQQQLLLATGSGTRGRLRTRHALHVLHPDVVDAHQRLMRRERGAVGCRGRAWQDRLDESALLVCDSSDSAHGPGRL